MEMICQIHSTEIQLFQLYHEIKQKTRLNSLRKIKAVDVGSIVREELI